MAKIQLKRSNQLDGGRAKQPTGGAGNETEHGELCINFNAADPSLFIKDSDGAIVKVGGPVDINLDGNVLNLDFDLTYTPAVDKGTVEAINAEDGTITIATVDLPLADSTNAGLFTAAEKSKLDGIEAGANVNVGTNLSEGTRTSTTVNVDSSTGTDATLSAASTSLAGVMSSADKSKLDGLNTNSQNDTSYLRLGSGTFSQTVSSTGTVTFSGDVEHEAGVSVTGGSAADSTIIGNANGIFIGNNNSIVAFNENTSISSIDIRARGLDVSGSGNRYGLYTSLSNRTFNNGHNVKVNRSVVNGAIGNPAVVAIYDAEIVNEQSTGTGTYYGYYSNLNSGRAPNGTVYNFYANGDALNYFGGLTEHASGVEVTAGNGIVTQGVAGAGNNSVELVADSNRTLRVSRNSVTAIPQASGSGNTYSVFGASVGGDVLTGTDNVVSLFGGGWQNSAKGKFNEAKGFSVGNITNLVPNSAGTTAYGYYSDVDTLSRNQTKSYNFYAAGDAPNLFVGDVITGANNVTRASLLAGTSDGFVTNNSGECVGSRRSANESPATLTINRGGGVNNRHLINFRPGSSTDCGWISTDGNTVTYNPGPSDYRLKNNINTLSNASFLIKQLNPVSFKYINSEIDKTYQGFIAHELQEHVPLAVEGTKDQTEPIGTVTDYDGTELETNVTEPGELTYEEQVEVTPYIPADPDSGIEEQEATYTTVTRTKTWTPTGTQPVYQGVDQTKLIPLLTKALQEALDKIETLETRLSDAGIA